MRVFHAGELNREVPAMTWRLFVLGALCALASPVVAQSLPNVRDGDVIFQTSKSSQSTAVQLATHSRYSHMGIIFQRNGKPFVFEATATVRFTPLTEWIARGERGAFVVKRIRSGLTDAQTKKLRSIAQAFSDRPYDLTFEWSDTRIYCSELVWKIYDRALGIQIGALQHLQDFDLTSPAVRSKMKERYGANVPMNETVISPSAMFDSSLLKVVASAGT